MNEREIELIPDSDLATCASFQKAFSIYRCFKPKQHKKLFYIHSGLNNGWILCEIQIGGEKILRSIWTWNEQIHHQNIFSIFHSNQRWLDPFLFCEVCVGVLLEAIFGKRHFTLQEKEVEVELGEFELIFLDIRLLFQFFDRTCLSGPIMIYLLLICDFGLIFCDLLWTQLSLLFYLPFEPKCLLTLLTSGGPLFS